MVCSLLIAEAFFHRKVVNIFIDYISFYSFYEQIQKIFVVKTPLPFLVKIFKISESPMKKPGSTPGITYFAYFANVMLFISSNTNGFHFNKHYKIFFI